MAEVVFQEVLSQPVQWTQPYTRPLIYSPTSSDRGYAMKDDGELIETDRYCTESGPISVKYTQKPISGSKYVPIHNTLAKIQ